MLNVSDFSLAEDQASPSKDKQLFTLVLFKFIYLSIFQLYLLANNFIWRCQILPPRLRIFFNSRLEANGC